MEYTQLKTPTLDPVIYVGNTALTSWAGWCLAYAEVAFGTPRLYASAWEAWLKTKHRHTNRSFPKGVYFPVWFSHFGSYGTPPRYANWGHVAIARVNDDGSMKLWSSPASTKPYADTYASIEQIENTYRSSYVGWSEDIANTQVIQQEDTMTIFIRPIGTLKAKFKKPIMMYDIATNEAKWHSGTEAEFVAKTTIVHGSTFYVTRDRWDKGDAYGFREEDIYAKGNSVTEVRQTNQAQDKLNAIRAILER